MELKAYNKGNKIHVYFDSSNMDSFNNQHVSKVVYEDKGAENLFDNSGDLNQNKLRLWPINNWKIRGKSIETDSLKGDSDGRFDPEDTGAFNNPGIRVNVELDEIGVDATTTTTI